MNTGNNQEEENLNAESKKHLENDNHREWDNDTYGHITNPEALRKKNEPQHQDDINIDASEKLKNENITANDDVASRNQNEDKGIGGKTY